MWYEACFLGIGYSRHLVITYHQLTSVRWWWSHFPKYCILRSNTFNQCQWRQLTRTIVVDTHSSLQMEKRRFA